MKFSKTSTTVLFLALSFVQIKTQKPGTVKTLTETTINLNYASLSSKASGAFPFGFGSTWESTIAGTKLNFSIDFNTKNFFVGIKAEAGWGIDCPLVNTNGCSYLNPAVNSENLDGTDVSFKTVLAPLNLTKDRQVKNTMANLVTKGNPYGGVASAGLGPNGIFWTFLRKAGNLTEDFGVQFSLKGGNLASNMVSKAADVGNLKPSITFVSKIPKQTYRATTAGPSGTGSENQPYASHALVGATVTMPYTAPPFGKATTPVPKDKIINILGSTEKICIAPNAPYVFVASLPQITINQIQDSFYGTVCKGAKSATDYKTKCTNPSSAPTATITIVNQKLTLKGSDWAYTVKDGSNTLGTTAVLLQPNTIPTGIFAPGAPCEGATFALGRNFFTKYSLNLVVQRTGGYSIGFTPLQGGGIGWLVWVGVIAGVIILIGIVAFFALSKGGDRNEGNTIEDEEGYAKQMDEN